MIANLCIAVRMNGILQNQIKYDSPSETSISRNGVSYYFHHARFQCAFYFGDYIDFHRLNGPAAFFSKDGTRVYRLDGRYSVSKEDVRLRLLSEIEFYKREFL